MSEPKTPENKPAQPAGPTPSKMEKLVALCRRRGFIWQSSEIYGGINGFWDYGPLGVELKRNLKDAWWRDIVRCPGRGPDGRLIDMVGVDCSIIMNPKVWVASGHAAGFADPMVDDKETKQRFRADHLFGVFLKERKDQPEGAALAAAVLTYEKRAADLVEHEMPPAATIVAANRHEAFETFVANIKKLSKDGRLPSINAVGGIEFTNATDREGRYFEVLFAPIPLAKQHAYAAAIPSPFTQKTGTLTEPRQFNLMFKTYVGAMESEESMAYLRPETAQGIFANFRNVVDTSRVKVPFGIAQVGKAFRNEVTPRNFTFRSREFEQMEIEFFIHPSTAHEWYKFWRDSRFAWWQSIGLTSLHLQLREHDKEELAHYAKEGAGTSDIEYKFPFTDPGFGELEGVAHRTDFDLRQHAQHSGLGDKLKYFDQEKNDRYFPHVIEPSAGADRGTLALLCEAYTDDPARPSGVVMKFHPRMAPIKAGVFPLVNKEGMPEVAEKLYMELRQHFMVEYDPKQAIGRRYARMDEAGTPYCFTIDGDTLKDQTVTVRHRDTLQQDRINISQVLAFLKERIV